MPKTIKNGNNQFRPIKPALFGTDVYSYCV